MGGELTKEHFVAAFLARDYHRMFHIIQIMPSWLDGQDPVLLHIAWAGCRLLLEQTRQAMQEFQATVTEVQAMLAEIKGVQADVTARQSRLARAEEDFDLFQAGYERGYATGWEHREQQEKDPLP